MEEMQALKKMKYGRLFRSRETRYQSDVIVKYKADGSIERYKARIVAKGYAETYGIDHQETFAPVAKMNGYCLGSYSSSSQSRWAYVKNAFLNGDLMEEVYMELPPRFNEESKNGKVCKLNKSLYDLKL